MSTPSSLLLIITSRREEIEAVQDALDTLMRGLGMDDDARWRVDLAVREAVANAIVHGNREDPRAVVRISAEARDGEMIVRIEDEGSGFELATVEDPRRPERRLAPSGRGVLLMRELVRDVCFERGRTGTVVTLRARLGG